MEEISNRMISGQLWKVEAGEAGGRKERKGKERRGLKRCTHVKTESTDAALWVA